MGRLGKGRAESWSRRKQRRKKRQEVSAPPVSALSGSTRLVAASQLGSKSPSERGDQSKPTRTSYTSFPKEAGAPATQTRFYFVFRI